MLELSLWQIGRGKKLRLRSKVCIRSVCEDKLILNRGNISACANEHKLMYDMDTSKYGRIFIIISPIINFFPTILIIANILMNVNNNFNKETKFYQ